MSEHTPPDEFQLLCDAVIEGGATPEQVQRLEQLALSSPELLRRYTELSTLHASLVLMGDEMKASGSAPGSNPLAEMPSPAYPDGGNVLGIIPGKQGAPRNRYRIGWKLIGASAAAILLMAFLLPRVTHSPATEPFATLTTKDGVRWESSSFPTIKGARIGQGRLRLAEGLATITFDNGARIELEGPADFELLSIERCQLYSGTIVATVANDLKGFIVETPNATLIDQGTSFGVHVSKNGVSNMEVFYGRVDVKHRVTGEAATVLESNAVRLSAKDIEPLDASDDSPPSVLIAPPTANRLVQITTATGAGQDRWIQRDEEKRIGNENLLLVKNASGPQAAYERKSYLRFDLTGVNKNNIATATLQLTATPTGMGYASRIQDTTFAVYGLTDTSLNHWDPGLINWNNAPANSDSEGLIDTHKVSLLGRFEIPQGQQHGVFSITGQALNEFLGVQSSDLVTLVILSETTETQKRALVHGFASRRHETLAPPTLRMWLTR